MPPQELAFAVPGAEEMTKTAVGLAGAAMAGVAEGVAIKMAPQLGDLETPVTWAVLLGVPAAGVAGALFAPKGMIADFLQGIATGGAAVAGYVLPWILMPEGLFGKGKTQLTAEQRAAIAAGGNVKQLQAGLDAPQRAQAATAKSLIEF